MMNLIALLLVLTGTANIDATGYLHQEILIIRNYNNNNDGLKKITNARWNNCGPSNDPFKLETLEINPSDIHFPEKMTISASAKLNGNVSSPIHVAVTMKRKLAFFWVTIPCEKQVGTCYYQNVCTLSPYKNDPTCPKLFNDFHLPCRCPVLEGDYSVEDMRINIPPIHVPEFLVNGKYGIRANAYDAQNRHLGCLNVQFHLK